MERLLADAEKLTGVKYDISNLNDVYQAIHVIQQELGITGTTALEAGETIEGSVGSLSASWENFMAGLGNPKADMEQLVTDVANSLAGAINNITPVIENMTKVLPTVVDAIIKSVGELLPTFVKTFAELVITITSALFEQLPVLFEAGYKLLEEIVDGFVKGVPTALPKMLSLIQNFANGLAVKAPELINKGFELLSKFVDGVMSAIPILIENVPTIISTFAGIINDNAPTIILLGAKLVLQIIEGLISAIPTLIANVPKICKAIFDVIIAFQWVNLGKNIMTMFTNGIKGMFGTIRNVASDTGKTLLETMETLPSKVFNLGKTIMNDFGKAITSMKNYIRTAVMNIVTLVRDTIATLPSKVMEIGKNVVTGLWTGIQSKLSWLYNKISDWCSNVISSFMDAFDSHSPARKMIPLGGFIAEGIAVGIEDDDTAENAIGEKAKDIIDLANYAMSGLSFGVGVDDLVTSSPMQKYQLDFNAQIGALNDGFERLINLVGQYLPNIANGMDRNIVLDGNALVVGMSRRMDSQLGKMAVAKGRGNV